LGDARDRLGWRLGFADVVQRFLVAVLSARHAGLGLPLPPLLRRLVSDKLDGPSLGDWGKATRELAVEILEHPHGNVDAFARLMAEPGGAPTATASALHALVKLRNQVFHEDGRLMVNERTAKGHLPDVTEHVRAVGHGLRIVRDHPVVVVVGSKEHPHSGSFCTRFQGFSGEPTQQSFTSDERVDLPIGVPLILTPAGEALVLDPFLACDELNGEQEVRLLDRRDVERGELLYSTASGGPRSPVDRDEPMDLLGVHTPRRLRSVDPAPFLEQLHYRDAPPELRLPGIKLEGFLGAGASSAVYLGRMERTRRAPSGHVAVKVLKRQVAGDRRQRERFRREYELLSELAHPGIVQVYDFREEPEHHIVMEYVDGNDLQSQLAYGRRFKPSDLVHIAREVLSALRKAHDRGVVHRDLKPSNLLLDSRGHVRVVDFGIASTRHRARLTASVDVLGTYAYAAPEQLIGSVEPDARADLYALGKILADLASSGLDTDGLEALPGLRAIVRRATRPGRDRRFADAREMLEALDEREQAGLDEGAPVQAGDVVGESYELLELRARALIGWWYLATEVATGRSAHVVLHPRNGGEALVDTIRDLPVDETRALGHPSVARDSDLVYTVVPGSSAIDSLERLLGLEPQRADSEARLDRPEALVVPDHLGWLDVNLQRIEERTAGDPRGGLIDLALLLELVVAIAIGQLRVLQGLGPLDGSWRERQPTLGKLVNAFTAHRMVSRRFSLGETLDQQTRALILARNEAAHSLLYEASEPQGSRRHLDCVDEWIELVLTLDAELDGPEALRPLLRRIGQEWAILRTIRTGQALYLTESGQLVEFAVRDDLELQVGRDQNELVREAAHRLTGLLPGFSFRDAVHIQADDGGLYELDLLVTDEAGRHLAVVEVKDRRSSVPLVARMERLGRLVDAAEAPVAALYDGAEWTWFAQVEEGLRLVDGGQEAVIELLHAARAEGSAAAAWPRLAELDQAPPPPVPRAEDPEPPTEWIRLVRQGLAERGLRYREADVAALLAGLGTARFGIVRGLSGTGKSSLVREVARLLGAEFLQIPVQPGWSDSYDLLGYYNPVDRRYVSTSLTAALYRANLPAWADVPLFVLFDEMDLARPEGWLASLLSAVERPAPERVLLLSNDVPSDAPAPRLLRNGGRELLIPDNVWFFGTENVDASRDVITDKIYSRAVIVEARPDLHPATPAKMKPLDLTASALRQDDLPPEELPGYAALEAELLAAMPADFDTAVGHRTVFKTSRLAAAMKRLGRAPGHAIDHVVTTRLLRRLGTSWLWKDDVVEVLEAVDGALTAHWRDDWGAPPEDARALLQRIRAAKQR